MINTNLLHYRLNYLTFKELQLIDVRIVMFSGIYENCTNCRSKHREWTSSNQFFKFLKVRVVKLHSPTILHLIICNVFSQYYVRYDCIILQPKNRISMSSRNLRTKCFESAWKLPFSEVTLANLEEAQATRMNRLNLQPFIICEGV